MTEHLNRILYSIQSLEPLPQVALKVQSIASREGIVPRELAHVIQTDAAITAKVLKLCNSAYYGFQRSIATLDEAANLLGTQALVSLVLTSCAGRYFRQFGASTAGSREQLWERSVRNALAAHTLARLKGGIDKNRAYTAGLLMNIGHLILDGFLSEDRERLSAEVAAGSSLLEAEQQILGIHHAEVGAQLLERWNFPAILIDAVRHHHEPDKAQVDKRLTQVVHLAEVISTALEEGRGLGPLADDLADYSLDLEGMAGLSVGELEDMLAGELTRAREFLAA